MLGNRAVSPSKNWNDHWQLWIPGRSDLFFFSVVNTGTLFSPFVVADGFAFSSVV